MRRPDLRTLRAGWLVVLCVAFATPVSNQQKPAAELPRLHEVFAPGGAILRDRNGDGTPDFVDAQFAMADAPDAAEVAAAANIAARLGFESAELNLPLPAEGGRVTIAIGPAGVKKAGLVADALGMPGLLPGEGLVTIAGTSQRPVLVAAGRDSSGTRAAAEFVAARLPYAWDVKGVSLGQVEQDAAAAVAAAQVCATAGQPVVVVRAGSDVIERVVIRADCPTSAHVVRLQAALRRVRPPKPGGARGPQPDAARGSKTSAPAPPRLDYPGVLAVRFEVHAPGAPTRLVDVKRETAPAPGPLGRRAGPAKDALDLSNLFDIEGLLGDSDSNLIPDRSDAFLVPDGPGTAPTIDLAARLGLESAGVSLPLVVPPAALGTPSAEPTLVLIGVSHPLIEQLVKEQKLDRSGLTPGQGLVRLVRKAFGEKSAIVITGADPAGLQRALRVVAGQFPHVGPRGKDRPTLDDVEEQVRRFVSGRSPAGQAAMGLYKAERLARTLAGKDLAQARLRLAVEKPDARLAEYATQQARQWLKAETIDVQVEALDVKAAAPASVDGTPISLDVALPSEVEEFWQIFRTDLLPAVKRGQTIHLEARLSEPRDLRRRLEAESRAQLQRAGAAPASTVTILSAYKQGYSWLDEVVKPALAGKAAASIVIRFAEAGPPPEWKQQAMYVPTRWLHEIFPIDEVLARDLRLDLARITFEKAPVGSPTYVVTAADAAGAEVFSGTFEPSTVVRPYFDRFPDYEHVRVATGWFRATSAGLTLVSRRIETDLERFWHVFQSRTLPAIYAYVMRQSDGKPRPEDAPHFGQLTLDVTLSEPHEKIGIDEELISPMEALHEDAYFAVLHFFDVLGRLTRGAPLDYPGHVVPVMRPRGDGAPGHARITFTGFTVPRPMAVIEYAERSGARGRAALDIPTIAVDRPSVTGVLVDAATSLLDRVEVRVKVDADADERDAWVARARALRVDAQMLSAEQALWTVEALGRLRAAGLYTDALAFRGMGELAVTAAWVHEPTTGTERRTKLAANGVPATLPDIATYLPAGNASQPEPAPLVQWKTPMGPSEAYATLGRLAGFPGATVYKAGESYLGQDVWAMDLTSPVLSSHWSQAKATTLKPTALFSGRQHANEVSSTSHILRLAERVLTDPARRPLLDKVNIVVHPITNPDGAALAQALWKDTPDYMLHAAYLGSLGVDVAAAQWEPDPIYPESPIRARLWRTWLPDLFLNPHGYPSHEWVQPFSEYAAWVRNRVTESRDWWGMRGWFMPSFSYIDDPKYPRHMDAAFEIRRRITAAINSVPAVKALNERAYDRYRRYGFAWNQEDFKLDFTDGVLIYTAVKGARPNPRGTDPTSRQPNITIWSGTTEAPDEPAYGDWLALVAEAGLVWNEAMVKYLADGKHEIERKRDAFWGGVTLSLSRARPPKEP